MNLYIMVAFGVAFMGAVMFGYWQYDRANDLQTSLAHSEAARAEDQRTAFETNEKNMHAIMDLREKAAQGQMELNYVNDKFNLIAEANDHLRNQANKWRKRLDDETFKRPKVVARAARRTINRSMRRAECITDPKCRPGPDGEPQFDPADTAKSLEPGGAGADTDNPEVGEGDAGAVGSGRDPTFRPAVLQQPGSTIVSAVGRRTHSLLTQTNS